MIPQNDLCKDVPLNVVGSSIFGRYPKISIEKTYNMIISDGFLVDYAGYRNVTNNSSTMLPAPINPNGKGRGLYHSTKLNRLVAVVYNGVYLIDSNFNITLIGTISTFVGDVFIAEDVQGHIAICDKSQIYIYTESTGTFARATVDGTNPLDFTPGYVAYHDGRFLSVDISLSNTNSNRTWRLSNPSANNSVFPSTSQFVGAFQTKSDIPTCIVPFPGKGNLILILGSNSGEFWMDQGLTLFPYQKNTGSNLDYGCINPDTVAISNEAVCWLAGNEKSGPFIVFTTGGAPQKISTDGIDFLLGNLSNPQDSHGFFFRQDGHLIYQITFVTDELSLIYDFNTQKIFHVSDENMSYHIGKRAVYFNNTYYFVSLNDGNLYEFDTSITTYNYGYNSKSQLVEHEIPRVRTMNTLRQKDGSNFIVNAIAILFEMGYQPDPGMSVERIEITNGGTGYTEAEVTIYGGGGQGATATVQFGGFDLLDGTSFLLLDGTDFLLLDSGDDINAIFVTNGGVNYTTPPTVVITGDGTGAMALAVLSINTLPRADLSISLNGGESFGNYVGLNFNTQGHYRNRLTYFGLGMSNEFTPQLRLWSKGRFVLGDGIASIYQ